MMMDPFSALSDEIILSVFSYLNAFDLTQCSLVGKRFRSLASDKYLWKQLFFSRFAQPLTTPIRRHPSRMHLSAADTGNCPNRLMNDQSDWKYIYMLTSNWSKGNAAITQLLIDLSNSSDGSTSVDKVARLLSPTAGSTYTIPKVIAQFSDSFLAIASTISFSRTPSVQLYSLPSASPLGSLQPLTPLPHPTAITSVSVHRESHGSHTYQLLVCYGSGGFDLYSVSLTSSSSSLNQFSYTNVASQPPPHISLSSVIMSAAPPGYQPDRRPIVKSALSSDYIATCSSDFVLTIYQLIPLSTTICATSTHAPSHVRCKMIHQYKAFSASHPLDLYIEPHVHSNSSSPFSLPPTTHSLYVSYTSTLYTGSLHPPAYEVTVQELVFKSSTLVSTHVYYPKYSALSVSPVYSYSPITEIKFRPPYLVSSHANSTITVYSFSSPFHSTSSRSSGSFEVGHIMNPWIQTLRSRKAKKELCYLNTLYDHTASVHAIDVNEQGRMITSGGDCGVRIWQLDPVDDEIDEEKSHDLDGIEAEETLTNRPENRERKRKREKEQERLSGVYTYKKKRYTRLLRKNHSDDFESEYNSSPLSSFSTPSSSRSAASISSPLSRSKPFRNSHYHSKTAPMTPKQRKDECIVILPHSFPSSSLSSSASSFGDASSSSSSVSENDILHSYDNDSQGIIHWLGFDEGRIVGVYGSQLEIMASTPSLPSPYSSPLSSSSSVVLSLPSIKGKEMQITEPKEESAREDVTTREHEDKISNNESLKEVVKVKIWDFWRGVH